MMDDAPLVSVVVPAFNAGGTIQQTLHSISQQTYRNLEVVVVDDGSTDDTAAIARRHSLVDARFRVISQRNGGVAAARNAGIRASDGAFVAFIDADDLWHPTKIAKQVDALLAGGPEMALVYSPFRVIDADGRVTEASHKYGVSGWVVHRHFHTNLVGNGSAILIRRSVLDEFGGFDPWLRQHGAEGCEDLLLQLRIAARYRFGEVSEYLVGYRRFRGTMSSNAEQMIRSGILAVTKALRECRDIPGLSARAMLQRYDWQRLKVDARKGRLRDALLSFVRQLAASPSFAVGALWTDILALAGKLRRRARPTGEPPRHFYEFDPKAGIDLDLDTPMTRALYRLAKLDQAYRPAAGAAPAQPARSRRPGGSSEAAMRTALDARGLDRSCTYQEG